MWNAIARIEYRWMFPGNDYILVSAKVECLDVAPQPSGGFRVHQEAEVDWNPDLPQPNTIFNK